MLEAIPFDKFDGTRNIFRDYFQSMQLGLSESMVH